MDTMAEKDKDEAVNELNGNSVGYLGYQKQKTAQAVEGRTSMKRRGPRTKWQRIIRETIFEVLIGAAIGLAFDAMLFIWLLVR